MRIRRKSGAARKRRFSPLLWTASFAAAAIVGLGVSGTLAQFTASITNDENHVQTAGPESFGFSESNVINGVPQEPACATASAGQAVTCSDINKYGTNGAVATPIAPGTTQQTTVRLQNTVAPSTPAGLSGDLTLQVGNCTNESSPTGANLAPGDLCGTLLVTIDCGTAPTAVHIGPVTMTALQTGMPAGGYPIAAPIQPGEFVDCTFTTDFPLTATSTTLQNVITSQPLTWVWTQAT